MSITICDPRSAYTTTCMAPNSPDAELWFTATSGRTQLSILFTPRLLGEVDLRAEWPEFKTSTYSSWGNPEVDVIDSFLIGKYRASDASIQASHAALYLRNYCLLAVTEAALTRDAPSPMEALRLLLTRYGPEVGYLTRFSEITAPNIDVKLVQIRSGLTRFLHEAWQNIATEVKRQSGLT